MKYKDYNLYDKILMEIKNNSCVTEKMISEKYYISERTVRRYIKDLKELNKIKLINSGKSKKWVIL